MKHNKYSWDYCIYLTTIIFLKINLVKVSTAVKFIFTTNIQDLFHTAKSTPIIYVLDCIKC